MESRTFRRDALRYIEDIDKAADELVAFFNKTNFTYTLPGASAVS